MIYVSLYLSILLSMSVFFLSYNLSQLIYHSFEMSNKEFLIKLRIILSIISFCSHMLISITFLAYTKDLIFSFIMIYFLIGYFVSDIFLLGKESDKEKISSITLMVINILSFLYTLFNIKKEDFGIFEQENVDELLRIRSKHKSSTFS